MAALIFMEFLPSIVANAVPIPSGPGALLHGRYPADLAYPGQGGRQRGGVALGVVMEEEVVSDHGLRFGESLICASIRSMVEFEDQERMLPDVVEKESGNPVTLTA